jgi:hypothetical protein
MKTVSKLAITTALAFLVFTVSVRAQTADTASGATSFNQQAGAPPPPPMPKDKTFFFFSSDDAVAVVGAELGPGHHIVTGAPLSAQTETETTQALANGTHIDRKSNGAFYRDSQGRMRMEVTHPLMRGPMMEPEAASGAGIGHQIVFIMDPVAKAHYVLDPDRKIARQVGPPPGADMKGMEKFHHGEFDSGKNVTTESLGTQTINGISATGTRITRTITAGEIGNDKPIQIVIERWYSPALQMNIMTKRTDPRFGTTTYQLTNISREEPAESLFQVPSDYTLTQGPPMHHMMMGHPQQ